MKIKVLDDKQIIHRFFRNNIGLFIYGIGDLDDFFWPDSLFYGLMDGNEVKAISLLYTGLSIPCLLALSENPEEKKHLADLMASIVEDLPDQFYAHISPGISSAISNFYQLEHQGRFYKMILKNKERIDKLNCGEGVNLGEKDIAEIEELYRSSYPENWFDRKMLDTQQYYGIRINRKLVSIAGVHVYSPKYKVAALGNITTHPKWRGQGWGSQVTAKLCQSLARTVEIIGLNVKTDNIPAVRCYQKLGFEIIAEYDEFMVKTIHGDKKIS